MSYITKDRCLIAADYMVINGYLAKRISFLANNDCNTAITISFEIYDSRGWWLFSIQRICSQLEASTSS